MNLLHGCTLVLLLISGRVSGQGLARTRSLGASNSESATLARTYAGSLAKAKQLSSNYKSASQSQKAACSGANAKGNLCASLGAGDSDVMAIATSPSVFSWTNPATLGTGPSGTTLQNPFSKVGDQGACWTCVSFAVAAAAEAAVARTLNLPGGSVSISVQDLAFCPEDPKDLRFCMTPWNLLPALSKLVQGHIAGPCLKYTASNENDDDTGAKCNYQCQTPDPYAAKGKFSVRMIRNLGAAQRHIRMYGGVITGINIYTDFRQFFAANPNGVYEGKMCTDGNDGKLEEYHAVVLVGYNNQEQYWIARNSWGPGFAQNGYFKIRFGKCGVAAIGDTYGIVWKPNAPRKIPVSLTPDVDNPGCYIYRARAGDTIGVLADTWGVDPGQLLFNNTDVIGAPDAPITGKLLGVCGISTNNVDIKTPSWVNSDIVATPEANTREQQTDGSGDTPSTSGTTPSGSTSDGSSRGGSSGDGSSRPPQAGGQTGGRNGGSIGLGNLPIVGGLIGNDREVSSDQPASNPAVPARIGGNALGGFIGHRRRLR